MIKGKHKKTTKKNKQKNKIEQNKKHWIQLNSNRKSNKATEIFKTPWMTHKEEEEYSKNKEC